MLIAGRPKVDLEPYQDELVHLYHEDLSFDQMATYLHDEHRISVTGRTVKRRFQGWNIQKRQAPPVISDDLCRRIKVLFFKVGLKDKELLYVLKREGFNISKWHLVKLRFQLNLQRRIRSSEKERANKVVQRMVTEELRKGQIEGYRRGLLHSYFRQQGYIVSRDRLFGVYRSLNPDAIKQRRQDLQRAHGEYIVPGPNFIWSLNGHDKLKPFGIEVYTCIDAYSRYIIWIYVGITNATAISCFTQYLQVLKDIKVAPKFIRSDRGGETVMMAQAHFKLQRESEPALQFQEYYLYGTSKANHRIEAW
jgi:hypothetical protein